MFLIMTILYYILASSAVLFYGIGINRTVSLHEDFSSVFLSCMKSLSTAAATTSVGCLVANWLLVPVGLSELYPFIVIIIFLIFTLLIEIFVGVGIKNAPLEFSVPLLSTLLGINEGISVGYAVIIACSCILSFYFLIIIFHSIKERINFYSQESGLKNYCIVLVSLAFTIIAISGWNISWFNVVLSGAGK